MPSTRTYVRSWHGGIVAPQMQGRIDSVQFQSGAADLRNFFVLPQGVLRKRAGLLDCGAAKSGQVRLLEFDAGPQQIVTIEAGAGYMRFWAGGERVIVTARAFQAAAFCTMTGSTVTQTGHSHAQDDLVVFSGGTLPPELTASTAYYVVNSLPGSNTFQVARTAGGSPITFSAPSAPTVTCKRRYLFGDTVLYLGTTYYCYLFNDSLTPTPGAYPGGNWHAMANDAASQAIYEIPTPYTAPQLRDLNYDQVNDVVTIVHQGSYPAELRRYDTTLWTLTAMPTEAGITAPNDVETLALSQNRLNIQSITIASPAEFNFGGPHGLSRGDGVYIRGTTFTAATTKFSPGFYLVHDVPVATKLQLKRYDHTIIETLALTVSNAGSIEYWPRESQSTNEYQVTSVAEDGQESRPTAPIECFNRLDGLGARNIVAWTHVDNAKRYRVYKRESGLYGYIGEVDATDGPQSSVVTWTFLSSGSQINWNGHPFKDNEPFRLVAAPGGSLPTGTSAGTLSAGTTYYVREPSANAFYFSTEPDKARITGGSGGTNATVVQRWFFSDDNIAPDLGQTPPLRDADELVTADKYPGAVGHYQQRKVLAGSLDSPQTFITSRPGTENDYSYRLPSNAADRLKWEVAVRRRAEIRHVIPLIDMVLLTSSGEVRVRPVNSEVLGPDTTESLVQTHIGSSRVRPQLTQQTLVFVSARGNHIHQLTGDAAGYATLDMSLRASHLFDGYTILESAQLRSPYPIDLWLRSDGKILACTYVPSERLASWQILETDGTIESIAVQRETEEDRLICSVVRTVNGSTVRRIEYMASLLPTSSWIGLDASVVKIPGGSATITGLTHLEGLTVGVIADGKQHPPRVVRGGKIVLQSDDYSSVIIGREFAAQMDSLPLALQVEAYAQGRQLSVTEAILRVVDSSGYLTIGAVDGTAVQVWERDQTGLLRTADIPVTVPGLWQKGGRIRITHYDAMPCQLVSMTLQVAIGD